MEKENKSIKKENKAKKENDTVEKKEIMFNMVSTTPTLEGEDARRFIEDMNRPMTEHEKMIQKRIRSRRDVEIIY